jgi:8-oxo-dGTP diphosphatase
LAAAMKHRISAGVIVDIEERILLVRHLKPIVYDFWVAPGGGVEGTEDLRVTVQRETREECGLEVEPLQIAYVEDMWTPEMRICKLWFIGRVIGGELTATASGAAAEHIVDARFMGRDDFRGKVVFPLVLREQYWVDKSSGFATTRYLGIREMTV